jgi:ribosomal protein S18 acetylase RimI-like enzyme
MEIGNETASRYCRFLNAEYFPQLYETFTEAFSDYVYPFALTETQFRNHIALNAVDLDQTVGCIDEGKLVGFSLNGFGLWDGKETVYDAGTGVIPAVRRQGISDAMFEMMIPEFRGKGIEQCLLEVIKGNDGAIDLYKKLGFDTTRELALLQCDGVVTSAYDAPPDVEIREIADPDWVLLSTFRDGHPSWQNSNDAISRSFAMKKMAGAFIDGRCVGYVVYSSRFGRIAQMAVSFNYRNRGIGTMLLQKVQSDTEPGYSLQVINIDKGLAAAVGFFTERGFYERLSQYEMLLKF